MRELEPKLESRSDAEVADIRDRLYSLAQLTFDMHASLHDSKFPVGLVDIDDTK